MNDNDKNGILNNANLNDNVITNDDQTKNTNINPEVNPFNNGIQNETIVNNTNSNYQTETNFVGAQNQNVINNVAQDIAPTNNPTQSTQFQNPYQNQSSNGYTSKKGNNYLAVIVILILSACIGVYIYKSNNKSTKKENNKSNQNQNSLNSVSFNKDLKIEPKLIEDNDNFSIAINGLEYDKTRDRYVIKYTVRKKNATYLSYYMRVSSIDGIDFVLNSEMNNLDKDENEKTGEIMIYLDNLMIVNVYDFKNLTISFSGNYHTNASSSLTDFKKEYNLEVYGNKVVQATNLGKTIYSDDNIEIRYIKTSYDVSARSLSATAPREAFKSMYFIVENKAQKFVNLYDSRISLGEGNEIKFNTEIYPLKTSIVNANLEEGFDTSTLSKIQMNIKYCLEGEYYLYYNQNSYINPDLQYFETGNIDFEYK